MRILAASGVRSAAPGAATQLEWLEQVAAARLDGVLLDLADFPRDDVEYLAQVRKIAIDLGLDLYGIDDASLLDPDAAPERYERTLRVAAGTGAAIVRTRLPVPGEVPPERYVRAGATAKAAARAAKAINVTIAIEPAAGTLGPQTADVRRLIVDADSAWLRYALPASADRSALGARDRIVLVVAGTAEVASAASVAAVVHAPVAFSDPEGAPARIARAAEELRRSTAVAVSIPG